MSEFVTIHNALRQSDSLGSYVKQQSPSNLPKLGRLMVAVLGTANNEVDIPFEPVKHSYLQRRETIRVAEQAALAHKFSDFVQQELEKLSTLSGVGPDQVRQIVVNGLGHLPSPSGLVHLLGVRKIQCPFDHEITSAWSQKEATYKALLFDILSGVQPFPNTPEEIFEFERFLFSKAAFWVGDKPVSWYQVVCGFGHDCPDFTARVEGLKHSLTAPLVALVPADLSQDFSSQDSFLKYLAFRRVCAIQITLNIEFPPPIFKALLLEFIKDEALGFDFSFFVSHPCADPDFNEDFLTIPMSILKIAMESPVKIAEAVQIFNELLLPRGDIPPEKALEMFLEVASHESPAMAFLQATTAYDAILQKDIKIERSQALTILLGLAKLESKDTEGLSAFCEAVKSNNLFVIDGDFLIFLLNYDSAAFPSNFIPYVEMVGFFAEILTHFKVIYRPPSTFWTCIFRLTSISRVKMEECIKTFSGRVTSDDGKIFCSVMMKFFEGHITPLHVETLSTFGMQGVPLLSVLASQKVELADHSFSDENPALRFEQVEAAVGRWDLTVEMSGHLCLEFMRLSLEEIEHLFLVLEQIEEYTGLRLSPQEAFTWLKLHPNSTHVEKILEEFRVLRQTLVWLHLEEPTLPLNFCGKLLGLSQQIELLPSSILSNDSAHSSETTRSLQVIASLMLRSTLPENPSFWAEALSLEDPKRNQLCPLHPNYPTGAAVLRRARLPTEDEERPVFDFQIVRISTGQTYHIRAVLPIEWYRFKQDPTLFTKIRRLAKIEGAEFGSEEPQPELEEQMKGLSLGFIRHIKMEIRRALLFMVTHLPIEPSSSLTGHFFSMDGGRELSLFPPSRLLAKTKKKECTIGRECDGIVIVMSQKMREGNLLEQEFPLDRGKLPGSLQFRFDPNNGNEVILEFAKQKSIVRYGNLIDEDCLTILLKRHLLELLLEQQLSS